MGFGGSIRNSKDVHQDQDPGFRIDGFQVGFIVLLFGDHLDITLRIAVLEDSHI